MRTLNLKDVWFLKHRQIEFTYVRENYGSRIDRAYVKDLSNNVIERYEVYRATDCVRLSTNRKLPSIGLR